MTADENHAAVLLLNSIAGMPAGEIAGCVNTWRFPLELLDTGMNALRAAGRFERKGKLSARERRAIERAIVSLAGVLAESASRAGRRAARRNHRRGDNVVDLAARRRQDTGGFSSAR